MKTYFSRKESIIMTAIEIIDELGIHELSLREIGNRQGITDSAIYKHFKSKEEIVLGVLDYYSRFYENIKNTISNSDFTAKEAILFFVRSKIESFENHPATTAIIHSFEVLRSDAPEVTRVKQIFSEEYDFIEQIVIAGQKGQNIRKDIKSTCLTDTIIGIERTIVLRWRMCNYAFPLKQTVIDTLNSILDLC